MYKRDIRNTKRATTNNTGIVVPAGTQVSVISKGELFQVCSPSYGFFYTDVSNLKK